MKRQFTNGLLIAGLMLTCSQAIAFSLTQKLSEGYNKAKELAGQAAEGVKSFYESAEEKFGPVVGQAYDKLSSAAKAKFNNEMARLKDMTPEQKKALKEKLKSAAKSGFDITVTLAKAVKEYKSEEATEETKKAAKGAIVKSAKGGLKSAKDVYSAYEANKGTDKEDDKD